LSDASKNSTESPQPTQTKSNPGQSWPGFEKVGREGVSRCLRHRFTQSWNPRPERLYDLPQRASCAVRNPSSSPNSSPSSTLSKFPVTQCLHRVMCNLQTCRESRRGQPFTLRL